jgi:phospho-N-acetylmuramoyl-pentapeptide-transferase
MLYHLLFPLHKYFIVFNVFRYVTFRTGGAIFTSLVISLLFGPSLIKKLKQYQIQQQIRPDGPQSHLPKAETPTMGGILILLSIVLSTLLWADLTNRFVWLCLFSMLAIGGVGFFDDFLKLTRKNSKGLPPRYKILCQILLGLSVGLFLYLWPTSSNISKLAIPFFKMWTPDLGWFYVILVMIVIVSTSNAVNLADGLDGLAIGLFLMASATFTLMAYLAGHAAVAKYLQILFVRGASEVTVFCGAMVGASIGFLWFNAYPAQIFMGDVGSLALGAALGTVAVIIKSELLLIIVGGVFVLEAISVILQIFSFRATGKRVFRMAPIHHHFELNGLLEPKIIVRFWIIAFIFALISLTTLKLR